MGSYPMKLEALCEVDAYVGMIPIGPSSWGIRVVAPVIGGTIEGPKIKGTFKPAMGDCALIRGDNCLELDVRAVIETDDGAFIYAYYPGLADMTQEHVDAFLQRGEVAEDVDLYVTPRFETAHPKYEWLARIQAVGRGRMALVEDKLRVTYSWYVLTP
jgi:hypothetical protein